MKIQRYEAEDNFPMRPCSFGKWVMMVIIAILLINCSQNCDSEMRKTRNKYGSPEEVNDYNSDGYHSVTWWYWSKGVSYTFTWGADVGGCEKSTYSFSPIDGQSSSENDSVRTTTKLISTEITGCELFLNP